MSIILTQNISQKQVLQQLLILTQELQLFWKLIHMTTVELKDYLEEQLIENPVLEESDAPDEGKEEDSSSDEEFNFDDFDDIRFLRDRNDDLPHYSSRKFYDDSEEDTTWENRISSADSLIDDLMCQLKVSNFSEEEKQIAAIIFVDTNDDGYQDTDVSEIEQRLLQG